MTPRTWIQPWAKHTLRTCLENTLINAENTLTSHTNPTKHAWIACTEQPYN